jgi:hypothetical protein
MQFPMIFPCYSHDITMIDIPMLFPWDSHAIPFQLSATKEVVEPRFLHRFQEPPPVVRAQGCQQGEGRWRFRALSHEKWGLFTKKNRAVFAANMARQTNG